MAGGVTTGHQPLLFFLFLLYISSLGEFLLPLVGLILRMATFEVNKYVPIISWSELMVYSPLSL